jgi:hypothetical protein
MMPEEERWSPQYEKAGEGGRSVKVGWGRVGDVLFDPPSRL